MSKVKGRIRIMTPTTNEVQSGELYLILLVARANQRYERCHKTTIFSGWFRLILSRKRRNFQRVNMARLDEGWSRLAEPLALERTEMDWSVSYLSIRMTGSVAFWFCRPPLTGITTREMSRATMSVLDRLQSNGVRKSVGSTEFEFYFTFLGDINFTAVDSTALHSDTM